MRTPPFGRAAEEQIQPLVGYEACGGEANALLDELEERAKQC